MTQESDVLVTTTTPDGADPEWDYALGFLKAYGFNRDATVSPSALGPMGSEIVQLPPPRGEVKPAEITYLGNQFIFHPGVYLITGGSGSGKSTFTTGLARMAPHAIERISYLEPEEGGNSHYREHDLMQAIVGAIIKSQKRVIIIDSIRTFFYASGLGGTGAGGVSMGLYSILTTWDIFAQRMGVTIMMVINPLAVRGELLEQLFEAAKGSVTAIIQFDSPTKYSYSSRKSQTRELKKGTLRSLADRMDNEAQRSSINVIRHNARNI